MTLNQPFTKVADVIARLSGLPATFAGCCLLIVFWAMLGPVMHFSEIWMLLVNTGTSVVTFLMVFLIQNNQTRHTHALQAKIDELIRSSEAHDHFMGIERLTHAEVEKFREDAGRHNEGEFSESNT
jgi:low affinity Fe/Cu permease